MRSFDILDPDTDLRGEKILEASAGTGKTFAIEHLATRLFLECGVEIEEMLAITYTRAAARELKMRIWENLKAALASLSSGECAWPYLKKHLGSKEAIRRLEGALAGFERAQIFTIHGFCQRMLSECSLEARCLQPAAEEAAPLGKALAGDLLDFLEKQEILCPEQMRELMKQKDVARLSKQLLNQPKSEEEGCFQDDCRAIEEAIRSAPSGDPEEEFGRIESLCKYTNFNRAILAAQTEALGRLFRGSASKEIIRKLLLKGGEWFSFVSLENRKKGKESLPQPPLVDWCLRHLHPLVLRAIEPKRLFQRLRFAWQNPFEVLLEEKGLFSPDFLIEKMRRSLAYPDFAAKMKSRFTAVIIDEFQDTDKVQWEIFSTLFRGAPFFYLVGDPKQSIYRFRNADLYTYYRAREALGTGAAYSLDTNYRSSPELVSALNDLFGERHVSEWLWLPGENRTEPYRPVKAGLKEAWNPGDGYKPLQFFRVENLKEASYAFIVEEIRRLRSHLGGYGSFAILVQSNQQGALLQEYLQSHAIPCAAKSRSSLGESLAMEALEELFNALFSPRDASAVSRFFAGPLSQNVDIEHLFFWKETLEQKGMVSFFRAFFANARIGGALARDLFQLAETLLIKNPQGPEAITRFFREIEEADPEEDALARRRTDGEEDAVQVLTMHTSKGLEFDVVFALGTPGPSPASPEDAAEDEAEKLRQLYVALTRAKKRLYIPLAPVKSKPGGEPPLELLFKRSKLGGVETLIESNPYIGLTVAGGFPELFSAPEETTSAPPFEPVSFPKPPGMVFSYTALAHSENAAPLPPLGAGKSIRTLPRGADVGTVFHKIFERIFTEEKSASEIVQEEVRRSPLAGWEEVVLEVVQKALSAPLLDGASLLDLDRSRVRAEVEFFFHAPPHFFKGCIDLLFRWKGRLYFVDWKTNWLENDSEESLRKAMDEHNYWMQASLYAEAVRRACPDVPFGKAIYLFLRGGALSFEPEPFRLPR